LEAIPPVSRKTLPGDLGDPSSSSGSAVIVLLHDDFLLRIFIQKTTRKNPKVFFFCFGCIYGRIANDDWKESSRNIF